VSESDLFEASVVGAVLGGMLIGLLGFIYQIAMRARAQDSEPAADERAAFADARIIACLSLVPQLCLMTLPFIYRKVSDIPKALGPAAVFVAAMLVCVWVWMAIKVLQSGSRARWFSFVNLLIFSGPGLASLVGFLIFLAMHWL